MEFSLLNRFSLKVRFSIIVVLMATITMILMSLIVYFSRKNSTFDNTTESIFNQLYILNDKVDLAESITANKDESAYQRFVVDILSENIFYNDGFAFLINNNGHIVSDLPDKFNEYLNPRNVSYLLGNPDSKFIRSGNFGNGWIFSTKTINGKYSLGIIIFEKDFWHPVKVSVLRLIIIGVSGGLIFFTILLHFIMQPITNHLNKLADKINTLSKGIFPEKIIIPRRDEIGEIANSLNQLIVGLRKTADFANEIGKGNYDFKHDPLSEQDVLGNALIETRENLQNAKIEQEKRNHEEEERKWVTQGLAEFSDILRIEYENIDKLGFSIIQKLIKYLDINQGGLFIVNDEDPKNVFLELIACYAFDRQKFTTIKFRPGESLVGACYLERKTSVIKKVPDTYISITSGLGEANPTSLLIVPLLLNEEIFGVIELASFKEFPKYKIEFVEKVAESIASSISTAKTNERTKKLLQQSQNQAEQMILQEKEMKQNMEEMQATQEEMQRILSLNNLRIEQAKAISNVRDICKNDEYNLEEILAKVTSVIVKGYQYSDFAGVRVKYKDIIAASSLFKETQWSIQEVINIKKDDSIIIEVAYVKEFAAADHGPFLNEELELLKNIAVVLKAFILDRSS